MTSWKLVRNMTVYMTNILTPTGPFNLASITNTFHTFVGAKHKLYILNLNDWKVCCSLAQSVKQPTWVCFDMLYQVSLFMFIFEFADFSIYYVQYLLFSFHLLFGRNKKNMSGTGDTTLPNFRPDRKLFFFIWLKANWCETLLYDP